MPASTLETIPAAWPLADRIHVLTTTRGGGVSEAPYASLNLSDGGDDDPGHVQENRKRVEARAGLPAAPCWLHQVHGVQVVRARHGAVREADAQWTDRPGEVLALLTADCLPVVLGDGRGTVVAVAHAGWRGLAAGILEATVAALPVDAAGVHAWIGPAIRADAYEVGAEVREAFVLADGGAAAAFTPSSRRGHFQADLVALARRRLSVAGVVTVTDSGLCTHADRRFYSHRREAPTGRQATFAWIRTST